MKAFKRNFNFNRGALLIVITILSSFAFVNIQTNSNPLSTWDKKMLKQANTGDTANYLTDEEKKLIFYTNLCRLNPKQFCQTVLADYLKKHPEQTKGVDGLQKELNTDNPMQALIPDKQLYTIAHDFAKKMGEEGKEGHPDFQNRIKPVMDRYLRLGENCDYGNKLALDAFMNLLIDSSDLVNLRHRKNLMDAKFMVIGVAGQPHKTYSWNFVMDFGG